MYHELLSNSRRSSPGWSGGSNRRNAAWSGRLPGRNGWNEVQRAARNARPDDLHPALLHVAATIRRAVVPDQTRQQRIRASPPVQCNPSVLPRLEKKMSVYHYTAIA